MLSAADKKRYARQVLLTEVGLAGQARLLQAAVALPEGADARAVELAADYLHRAGLRVDPDAVTEVAVPGRDAVRALAGRPELHEAAAALAGAFAAVEAIKHALGVGKRAVLPAGLTLDREPTP
jgi:hypothetical protein